MRLRLTLLVIRTCINALVVLPAWSQAAPEITLTRLDCGGSRCMDHHEDEAGEHRSHRLVPPLQDQIPWSTTGTTSPTEKLKAEDLGYPHELWIRSMWVTAERVREETHLRAVTSPR